jgi:hypothetical protein
MQEEHQDRIYPSDRAVVDIMAAASPATELDVVECLRYPREERGLRPGKRDGPRHFSWFRTVVGDYFRQRSDRQYPPSANSGSEYANPGGLTAAFFDALEGDDHVAR